MTKPAKNGKNARQDAAPPKNEKNAPKWRVTGFRWIQPHQLCPHPEAEVPMSEEDAEALGESVSGNGLIQPLLVMPRGDRATFWIVDGIHRFRTAPKGEPLPCVLVETDDVRGLALECASVGRSRSTGQRLLVWMERNKAAVLEAAEMGREGTQFGTALSRDSAEKIKAFSSDAISKTVGVSNKDTLLAIQLLRSHEERRGLPSVVGGLKEDGAKLEEGDPELAAIDDAWGRVLAGTLPIRRWTAAVGGAKKTKGVGKAATDWLVVGLRTLSSLPGLSANWEKLSLDNRLQLLEKAREVAAGLPRDLREALASN